jgi:mycothione reductase
MHKYDIVIVGSGAGLSTLTDALQNGLSCALIENSKFGGTCLTRGCLPSKILVHPADLIRETQHAKNVGLSYTAPSADWDAISKRMWHVIDESKAIERSMSNVQGLTVYKGTAEFTGKYTMRVKDKNGLYSDKFKGARFILTAGARSFVPPIDGLEDTGYVTSESFFGDKFPSKPWSSLVIIGGGAIGAEFAHIFSAFGTKVTLVEMQPHLVTLEEEEVSAMLETHFVNNGVDVLLNCKAVLAAKSGTQKSVTVENALTGESMTIKCEEILVASGVRSNADLLKVEKAGVEVSAGGWIITNEYLETSVKNIWAYGDINGKFQFRHKANYEAQICNHNIFEDEEKRVADYTKVPWAIFTNPQIAHVGMTEKQAQQAHERILVGTNRYSSVAHGFAMGYSKGDSDDGFVKLIADEHMKIIGAHIIGPHAAILIQSFVYLMNTEFVCKLKHVHDADPIQAHTDRVEGGTFDPMYKAMVIHPSLSEVVGWVIGNIEWRE